MDGRHLKGEHNNQMSDGFVGRGCVGEEIQTGGTHGGGRFIVSGDEMRDEKN